jgi:DNA topoisomerase-2
MQENEPQMIDLAFSKKKADERKIWLQNFVPGTYLDMSGKEKISYNDFINKELILFSMADNFRSIPSLVDGFKPGQRKILYTALRRNLKKDIKVVELAGLVSGLTAYSYGETSLQQTIVGLAQTFVGSNNINVLEPSGNFGSRLQGGSDAACLLSLVASSMPTMSRFSHTTRMMARRSNQKPTYPLFLWCWSTVPTALALVGQHPFRTTTPQILSRISDSEWLEAQRPI